MDGLSSATAVFATLQTALSVIKYIRTVAGANKARQELLQELVQVRGLLATLQDLYQDTLSETWATALHDADGSLFALQKLVNEMYATIQGRKSVNTGDGLPKDSSPVKDKIQQLTNNLKNLKWPFTEAKVKDLLVSLERIKSGLLLTLSHDSLSINRLIRQELGEIHEDTKDMKASVNNVEIKLGDIQGTTTRIDKQTNELYDLAKGNEVWTKERERLLESISSIDLSFRKSSASDDDVQKYSSWIRTHPKFCDWMATGGSFLLHGPAGTGKSTVTRVVEASLRATKDSCVIVVDFERDSAHSIELREILANIVMNMIKEKRQFQKYYNKLMPTGLGPLTIEESLRIIHRARQDFEQFYLILEALDACAESRIEEFLMTLKQMRAPLAVYATSRFRPTGSVFTYVVDISEQKDDVDQRLKSYIENRLLTDSKHPKLFSVDNRLPEIADLVVKRSGGMFLYVKLLLDKLCAARSWKGVESVMKSLATSIDQAYASKLLNIADQDIKESKLASVVLRFLAENPGQCSSNTLLAYIEDTGHGLFQGSEAVETKIEHCVACCSGLVVGREDGVALLHLSLQEFLESTLRDYEREDHWIEAYKADHSIVKSRILSE